MSQRRSSGQSPSDIILSGDGSAKTPGPTVEAFRQGLRNLGYDEEKNVLVEYRYVRGYDDLIVEYENEDYTVVCFSMRQNSVTKSPPFCDSTSESPSKTLDVS
jgi:hypothetical protein